MSSATPVGYTYDANNRLILRSHDADGYYGTIADTTRTLYVQEMGQIVLELEKTGSWADFGAEDLTHRYLWGPGANNLLVDEAVSDLFDAEQNDTFHALPDHLGTVRDLVSYDPIAEETVLRKHTSFDSFGQVVDEAYYDKSGDPIASSHAEAVDQLFMYTGAMRDGDTGLQNHWNRWYDPATGSWISVDPIKDGVNWYGYVGNAATVFTDPSGLAGVHHDESRRSRHFAAVGRWANGPGTGWSIIDSPVAALGSVAGNLVGKPVVWVYTNWDEGTYEDRIAAIECRQDVVNGGGDMGTGGALVNLYAGATTDRIAYGIVGYDPIADVELSGSERITNIAGGTAGYAGTWIPVAGVVRPIAGVGAGTGAAARYPTYMHFRRQGFTAAQANHLSKPYTGMGHHFPIRQALGRDLGLSRRIVDSPLNVLRPQGMCRGHFYELHYKVDPTFFGTGFPRSIGGSWSGGQLGLTKYGTPGRIWYGTPEPLKGTTGTGVGAIGIIQSPDLPDSE